MINESLFSSNSNEWATPQKFFDELNAEFHFNLDPCSTHENAKCPKHFTLDEDGLSQNWGGVQSVLQSTLRKGYCHLGSQVLRGKPKTKHPRSDAHTCKDGHILPPRLHLSQGEGNPFHPWAFALQREQARRTLSVNGGNLLAYAI